MQSEPPRSGLSFRHEEEAQGLVSSVFRDVRSRMAFVPALFKALAVEPPVLELAWLQARALLDDPRSPGATERLREAARPRLSYRPSPAVRAAAAPFLAELPGMLLVVTSLGLSLDSRLRTRPRPPAALPGPGPLPETAVPEERGEHPLFEEVRAAYGTTYVPSMYRALAARGVLEEAWGAIAPFLGEPRGRSLVAELERAAEREALGFPEAAFFDAQSARPVLDQFRVALPRNLVFAAAAAEA